MPASLTPRQKKILDFIAQAVRDAGMPPTLREIAARFSVTVGGLQKQIRALESKGALKRLKGAARGLVVTARPGALPVLGSVPAGGPSEALEDVEGHMRLEGWGADYLLRVKGESMADELVEGDLVAVRRTPTAEDRDLVIAHVDEGEATVKRLRRRGRRAWLEPANPRYKPIEGPFRVVGKVTGMMRRYARRRGG